MKKDEKDTKGFFRKLWYAIDKVEKYGELSAEGLGNAFKYLIILVLIIGVVSSFVSVYRTSGEIKNVSKEIEQHAPEFTYKDKMLKVDSQEPIINESESFGKIIVDTNVETEEKVNEYINDIKEQEKAIIILKDKLILKQAGIETNIQYKYEELFKEIDINEFDKNSLVQYLQGADMLPVYLNLFLSLFVYVFIIELINVLMYIIMISIFGYLTSKILKLRMRYVAIFNMAIYAITLPSLLYIIYMLVNAFIDYRVPYFEVMYMLVATIYMIAALFILKIEFNKTQGEVQKVLEVEKEVKEELKKQEDKKEADKKEKDKKEEKEKKEKKQQDGDEQPEGSNA